MAGSIRKRIGKDGKIRYSVTVEKGTDPYGKRIREYKTFDTLKEARAALRNYPVFRNNSSYSIYDNRTVESVFEEWITAHSAEIAVNTAKGYRNNLRNHIYPYIGDIPIRRLTPAMLNDLYEELCNKGLNVRSVQYCHATIHLALKYALMMRYIDVNVSEMANVPAKKKYKPYIYNDAELAELFKAAKGTLFEIPVYIAVCLGLRRGEVLALKWSDIDFEEKTLTVCKALVSVDGKKTVGKTKTEAGNRVMAVPDSLLTKLEEHRKKQEEYAEKIGPLWKDGDYIVCRRDGLPYDTYAFSQMFRRFLRRENLPHCRFHDLRHACATIMIKRGVNMKVLQARLGHTDISTTLNIYSHSDISSQNTAAEILENIIFGK